MLGRLHGVTFLTVAHSMQNDPVVSKASELLRLGLMPSVDAIKAGQVGQPHINTTMLQGAH
jgi:hypothetical protein